MYSKDMSRWQDEVTAEEWESWQRIARQASQGRSRSSYNSSQDLASNVMEKLIKAEERPENIEAWIRRVTTTTFIDMWRTRSKFSKVDIDDDRHMEDQFFLRQITETMMGPKTAFILQETVNELLGELSEKNQKLVLMKAAGFSSAEIAEELGYAGHLMRPPYGSSDENTRRAAASCGINAVVNWNSELWEGHVDILQRPGLQPGDIFLTHFRSDLLDNLIAFKAALDQQGFTIGRLEDYLPNS